MAGRVILNETSYYDAGVIQEIPAELKTRGFVKAFEGYITKAAWSMTDMFHLKAIEIIADSLRGAVENTPAGWEGMALG